ncbi:hypothetical protein CASFOL_039250 [Castilleja foliolosa]|uniref:Uncharacterized protein n=1 Tax=Castilleja foliolosa TaxID=1961234 RepID=A0ABD3BIK6_9LAMI
MADASHLERMGRELKCPICLSLLNSAVSLTCNHAFCKSMKSASNCPVCKVPYRRREIRPAPHMDNLVSVYKSMEAASGVDIFVTQTTSAKLPGEDNNQTGDNIHEVQDKAQAQLQTVAYADQKQRQRMGSKRGSVSTQRSSQSNLSKPSFPNKKRVQVPMHQTSGPQMEHEKLGNVTGETDRKEPTLSPFFWLRDEVDLEKISQQTTDDVMYTPADTPCFSDIKDSDDERGACNLQNGADFIDSETFDWTQRPCSPELCSSPLAMQIEDTAEENGAQEKAEAAMKEIITKPKVSPKKRICLGKKRRMNKISKNGSGGITASIKGVGNGTEIRKSKRAKKTIFEVTPVHIESDKVINQDILEGNKDDPLIFKGKHRKSKKAFTSNDCVQEKKNINLSDGTGPLPSSENNTSPYVSASEIFEKSREISSKLKKRGKSVKNSTKRLSQQENKDGSGESGTGNGNIITESNTNLLPFANDEVLEMGTRRTSTGERIKIPKSAKKVKFSNERMSKNNSNGVPSTVEEEAVMKCQMLQEIGVKVPTNMNKTISSSNGGVLLKCTASSSTVHCAFCQSSEESKATGSMVHYLNGKIAADNSIARTDVIHAHKHCTEWAPNVYFEGDNVINLETELARSKRIRCCCCGVKGAALGCYEKSCRKSFHVTCARLTPECRWDYENFVMLCPIHASCQLPSEMPKSQTRQKEKSALKRKSCNHQPKIADECKHDSTMQWKSQKKFNKLVLCCSALTNTEKEIVTEFENLSGVTILKNWDPTVTHVIASTDENGACRRTLKYLMGVLEGKWILSVEWIKACIGAGELVDEQLYEISIDIHGIRDGPRLGRSRLLYKQPKLFEGYTFFFTGDFVPSYKGYLHDLIIAAGGKVLSRKPVARDYASSVKTAKTFIIYSIELPYQSTPSNVSSILNQRRAEAEALARSSGAVVVSNSWILNSIAGCKLQGTGS